VVEPPKQQMSKTSNAGFYHQPQAAQKTSADQGDADEDAYEWDESPTKGKKSNLMGGSTAQNFYKPAA
jgi:hypothetical protein